MLPKRRGRRPKGQRLLCYLGSERVTHTSTLRVDAVPTGGAVTHNSTKWMLVGPVWQVSVTSAGSTIGNDGVVGDYARRERPIRVTREISAPAEVVWAVIATPGHLEHVHPFCEHNPVTEWPGAASRDEIHYRSGWVYERTFTHWVDGVGYDLDIGAPGLQLGNQRVATIAYSHPWAAVSSSTFGPRSNDAPLLAFGNEGRGMVRDARRASEGKPIWNSPVVLAAVITSYHGL